MTGRHRIDDDLDGAAQTVERPPDPRFRHAASGRAQVPTGRVPRVRDRPAELPRDQYREWASGELPRVLPDPAAGWTEIHPQGMPAVDHPPVPPPSPRPRPARVVRGPASIWPGVVATIAILAALIAGTYAIGAQRHASDLERQHQDLHTEQISQRQRLAAAEQAAADAKAAAAEAENDLDQLRKRVGLLEEDPTTSGS